MAKIKPIRITATVFKVATLIDGGYRITLDAIPPTELSEIMRIIESKKPGFCLEIVALPVDISKGKNLTGLDYGTKKETEKSTEDHPPKVDRRRDAKRRDKLEGKKV